ncbi:hypothetical protein M3181_03875 [Mesobacillus maritimus]|uniref:hypothetical protein n=1 Tax=Mesobacillus maritimus TaxID=1643336 RepID=UPI00203C7BDF|nr:hypothetical protein [Mesobacillus maritimus]MCM3668139.1 hypothetical protein [Mesobacillus maritimus]
MEVMTQRKPEKRSKHWLLLLILPVLLAGIGWVLPVGKEPSIVTAEATISLGNYQHQKLNHANHVVKMLSHAPFYEEHLPSVLVENMVPPELTVTAINETTVRLAYSSSSSEEASQVVNDVASAFLQMDQEKFDKKERIVQDSITALEDEEVSPEAKVEQVRLLNELKTLQFSMEPAVLLEAGNVDEVAIEQKTLGSRERAIVGGLIGVSLSFLWLTLPKLVSNHKRSY